MSFSLNDFRDLLALLDAHPEWREELRRVLLSEDFLALPRSVREIAELQKRTERTVAELAEAQKRAEERLSRLEQAVAELAEAQKRAEERLSRLEQRVARLEQTVAELIEAQKRAEERLSRLEQTVAELIEAQKRTEQRIEELAEAQRRNEQQILELIEIVKRHEERLASLEERMSVVEGRLTNVEERLTVVEVRLDRLNERVDGMDSRLAKVDGRTLEIEYERKAGGYFGRIISNPQVVSLGEWEKKLSPPLTGEEFGDIWLADLILRGRLRTVPKGQPERDAWLVIEISVLVDVEDVERAVRRAELLRKANLLVLPVVAGENVTERALQMAEEWGVVLVKDGGMRFLEQALQRYG
ncbi:MAG: hypothetical protein RML93_05240 [Anaerolineales bacterium]|nr:hypothetical protein [Anaerolineales bacterium]MCS7248901.1 hypothetical protein [Anaerolineales bacterium]MDW8162714.1 hypothetical protein [Anaerolineales bacterium]MDW8446679.1 hypothetical protein [Anaerolineales bacterium]